MDITAKLKVLDQIYSLYNYFTGGWDYACQRYCAYCCTSKVTMTTLEGYKIVEHCTSHDKPDLFEKLKSGSCRSRFQPKITTNKLTELYAQKDDMPDEKEKRNKAIQKFKEEIKKNEKIKEIREKVVELCKKFPLYPNF